MRAVNLLPRDSGRSSRKSAKSLVLVGAVGGLVLLAGLGGGFMMTSSALSAKEGELANKQAEFASMPRPEEPASDQPDETAELAGERMPRVAALSAVLAERVAWDRILRRFSLVLPDDIWLQTMALTSPKVGATEAGAAPTEAAQSFSITGRTYSHDGVARLLSRLTALPDLENVQLQTSHVTAVGTQDLVEFTIVAGVRTEGASA
jgi:Tfp pilus assembly protein PilN